MFTVRYDLGLQIRQIQFRPSRVKEFPTRVLLYYIFCPWLLVTNLHSFETAVSHNSYLCASPYFSIGH